MDKQKQLMTAWHTLMRIAAGSENIAEGTNHRVGQSNLVPAGALDERWLNAATPRIGAIRHQWGSEIDLWLRVSFGGSTRDDTETGS